MKHSFSNTLKAGAVASVLALSVPNMAFSASIEVRVENVIAEHLSVDANKVKGKASFVDDLGADSLDIVEIIMALEEEFAIEIPDEQAEKIKTVGDVVAYIKKREDKK